MNEAEQRLWDAYPRGDLVDLRAADSGEIRAEVISSLLLGAADTEPGHFPGVRLSGARISGRLCLDGVSVDTVLDCTDCVFEESIGFVESALRTLRISRCRLPAFHGSRMRMDGLLSLSGSTVEGDIRLDHARLDSEARLDHVTAGEIAAEGVAVQGALDCTGTTVRRGLVLRGAHISGNLAMSGARLTTVEDRAALLADNLTIGGRFNAGGMTVDGEMSLQNARIGGSFHLRATQLNNPGQTALSCGGLSVGGGVFAYRGFTVEGGIRMVGARLEANLTLDGAVITHPGGVALDLDGATIRHVRARGMAVRAGQTSLRGTELVGALDLREASFEDDSADRVLAIENATMGELDLRDVRARSEVMVRTSSIRNRILLHDAQIHHPGGIALRLSRTEVGADVFANRLDLEGTLKLTSARIGQALSLVGARLSAPDGIAIDARGLVAGVLTLHPAEPLRGTVVLRHAQLGVVRDEPAMWPEQLILSGLRYEALEPRLPARERLAWLTRSPDGYESQPYEQLAAHYTAFGQHADARSVLYAKERRRRRTETRLLRAWSILQEITTGFGYQTWRAAVWLAALVAIGAIVYGLERPTPLKKDEAPHFNPAIYTLDLLLPIVDLGQEHAFNPAGGYQWLSYAFVATGWVLATTVAAGAARVLYRR